MQWYFGSTLGLVGKNFKLGRHDRRAKSNSWGGTAVLVAQFPPKCEGTAIFLPNLFQKFVRYRDPSTYGPRLPVHTFGKTWSIQADPWFMEKLNKRDLHKKWVVAVAVQQSAAAPEVDGFCLATAVQRCACCAVVAAPHRCFSYLAVEVPAAQRRRTENL